jgi:xanthine dehydrogenase accessory factor
MLVRDDGSSCGSVSGGCVEEDLVARYLDGQLQAGLPVLVDYGVDRAQASRLGLPCGGRLELLIEQPDSAAQFQVLLDKIKSHQLIRRRVCLNTGEVSLHPAAPGDGLTYDASYVNKVFGPDWLMLIIGANHLSQYVAQLALMLDYRVLVCDPREGCEQYGAIDGVEHVRSMPDDTVREYVVHPRSVVIALTHDPKLDDMALLEALTSQAFYVGAIGSRLNSDKRRERLKTLGLSSQQLQQLHAPVGLPIGSHSPPEIAVSILAEITALRHKASQTLKGKASAA